MRKLNPLLSALFLLVLSGLLTGCGTGIGPRSIGNERLLYNEVLRKTQDEQLLMNLVRLRYNDTPQFMDLGSVVAQYGVETRGRTSVQAGIQGFFSGTSPDSGSATLGGEFIYQERPTVTYSPLQGEQFAKRLLAPIPLEMLYLLSTSGWSIERLTLICVDQINVVRNARGASGPTPLHAPEFKEFHRVAELLRLMTHNDLIKLYAEPTPDEQFKSLYLIISRPADPELSGAVDEFLKHVDLPPGATKIRMTKAFYPRSPDAIAFRARSLMGVLYFCSHAVRVPQEHIDQGIVRVTKTSDGKPFAWADVHHGYLTINSSAEEPKGDMLKVFYRDYWFFIPDTDIDSKATFNLLQILFSLQSTTGSDRQPLLTIPTH